MRVSSEIKSGSESKSESESETKSGSGSKTKQCAVSSEIKHESVQQNSAQGPC